MGHISEVSALTTTQWCEYSAREESQYCVCLCVGKVGKGGLPGQARTALQKTNGQPRWSDRVQLKQI